METVAFVMSPEAWNAVIVAVGGTVSTGLIAHFTARRQAHKDGSEEDRLRRGELREDNQALRHENKDLREELKAAKMLISKLENELHTLSESRIARQEVDAASEKRSIESGRE